MYVHSNRTLMPWCSGEDINHGHQHAGSSDATQSLAGALEAFAREPEERVDCDEALERPQGCDALACVRQDRLKVAVMTDLERLDLVERRLVGFYEGSCEALVHACTPLALALLFESTGHQR